MHESNGWMLGNRLVTGSWVVFQLAVKSNVGNGNEKLGKGLDDITQGWR